MLDVQTDKPNPVKKRSETQASAASVVKETTDERTGTCVN